MAKPSFSIPQSYQNEPEESVTMGSSSAMLPETQHSAESDVDPFVSLTRHSSSVQVKDSNSPPGTITIREIFKASCLQSLRNLELLVPLVGRAMKEYMTTYTLSLMTV